MNTEPTSHRNGFPICPTTASDTMATSYTPTIGAQTAASSPLKSGTKSSAWTPSTGRDSCKRQRSSQSGSVPKRQLSPSTESRPQTTNLRRTSTDVSSSRSTKTAGQLLLNDISEEDVSSHRTHGRPRDYDSVEDDGVKTVMSIVWSAGRLGASYYDTDSAQLHLLMDVVETNDFQFLRKVKEQVQPDFIITSSKQDERLLKALEGEEGENNEEPMSKNTQVEILPSVDFSLETCRRRIIALSSLPGMPHHYTDEERAIFMNSLVPFDNVNMVRAAGALIKFLEKERLGVELEDPDVRVPIFGLKLFSLKDLLIVDRNTYSALQIFQKESHPSVYKAGAGNSGAKEGLSLYGILNSTKSVLGSRLMRIWFLRPTRDINVLKERQKAVSFFVAPRNSEVAASLQDCLKNVKNVSRILSRMTTSQASVGDWQALYKTAYNAIYIADLCKTIPQDVAIARKIAQDFTEELHRIASLINKIVDFDDSAEQNRFVVKPGVDPVLDEKKRTYNGLPDFMTKVAREELNKLSPSITECNVIYLPQLGYLLAIPRIPEMKDEKDFEIEGLEFLFLSNNKVHFKSASTRELDVLLGDTQCDITDHETAIMHRLQTIILEHTKVLMDVMECCAELDCLISLALCAREYNYTCPQMTSEAIIAVEGARHPLQELCVNQFVPNDILIDNDNGRVKILTGPNASGKSVYLKQVGLIVFLAHIGSFVPADSATIGITDRIFTRIHTMETVSVGLSTFMIDLNQVAGAVQDATEKSLVIIDEFGKGTATVDGLSLLSAILRHWLALGTKCPKSLISTHFHSLIRQHLLPKSPLVKYQTMEVMHDAEELIFLYQLIDGHANSSYACHVATLAGVPDELVRRASQVSELIRKNKPVQRKESTSLEIQHERCFAIVKRFMELELENDDLSAFLSDFVLPTGKEIIQTSIRT